MVVLRTSCCQISLSWQLGKSGAIMICRFLCSPLGFRKIQAVNEAVQEIQVQVNLTRSYFMVTGYSCYEQPWTTTTTFM